MSRTPITRVGASRALAAGSILAAALAVPALLGGNPAQAVTACTPSTATPAAVIDTATPELGKTIAFHGTGWCHPTDGGSTVAVKIDAGDISRLDTSVSSNRSVWAIVTADAVTGDFSGSFTLPDGTTGTSSPALAEGSHTLSFLSGSLKSGDTVRSVVVGFTIGTASSGGSSTPAGPCTPTTSSAAVHLGSTTATLGGTVHVTGTGFCNPTGGGSTIGVKLDDGTYALPTGSTTWTTIHADDSDGTFSVDIKLPDGTTATSKPAFPRGGHTLRFLTGSLAPGDTIRTLKSETFSIGAYAPSDLPDPLASTDLRKHARNGVKAALKAKKVVVKLPHTPAGTWVLATLYDQDGSPSYPWETWQQLPASHQLTLARKPITKAGATGKQKLVVQSGDERKVGDLLGWAKLTLPTAATTTSSGSTGSTSTTSSGSGTSTTTGTTTESGTTAPAAPKQPFTAYADLDPRKHGSVKGSTDAGILTLRMTKAAAGDLVYVTLYTPEVTVPAGWATVAANKTVKVDLTHLTGYAGATVQDTHGTLLGWAPVSLGDAGAAAEPTAAPEPTTTATDSPTEAETVPVAAVTSDDGWLTGTDGLLLAVGALLLAGASVVTRLPRPFRRTPGGVA
jgi:hypothetical protein